MGGSHLSELCSSDAVEPIYCYLRQVAPEVVEWVDRKDDEGEDAVVKYVNGVWGYRDRDGRTAFHWAVGLRNYVLARALTKEPYHSPVLSEDEDGVTPFMTACMVGAPEDFVSWLLEKSEAVYDLFLKCPMLQRRRPREEGKETNDRGQAVVGSVHSGEGNIERGVAATNNALNVLDEVSINKVSTSNGSTAKYNIVNAEDSLGNTALLHVVSRGHSHLVDFLLKSGAELSHQNKHGQSALHRSVGRGNVSIVEKLLSASKQVMNKSIGAHRRWVNLQDDRGDSALFYASMENNEELGSLLLRNGADRDLRNKEGKEFWEV